MASNTIDAFLESTSARIERTRKSRIWDLWIDERPIHVRVVTAPPTVELSAGCNDAHDYAVLRQVAEGLAAACGRLANGPIKWSHFRHSMSVRLHKIRIEESHGSEADLPVPIRIAPAVSRSGPHA